MLPPALFYVLGFVLVFFGVLRLVFMGFRAPKTTPDDSLQVRTEKRGFGLVGLLGGGLMTAAKRHKVMGGLWIVLGIYVAWTGVTMSRTQQLAQPQPPQRDATDRARVVRVQAPQDLPVGSLPPSDAGDGASEPPSMRAAPEPAPPVRK